VGWLIDGSNLGGKLGGAAGARDAGEVVRRVVAWARGRKEQIVLVFDGPGSPDVAARYGPVRVVWSGAASADERITARVEAGSGRWTVVTGDRELAARCRALGARVLPPSELLATVDRPRRGRPTSARQAESESEKPPAHAEERDLWRRVFDPENGGTQDP
jgi:hypothetical protein